MARILPVETTRCEKGLFEAARKRVGAVGTDRTGEQPAVATDDTARDPAGGAIRCGAADGSGRGVRLFLEEDTAPPLLGALPPARVGTAALLLGPEGGWTDRETGIGEGGGLDKGVARPTSPAGGDSGSRGDRRADGRGPYNGIGLGTATGDLRLRLHHNRGILLRPMARHAPAASEKRQAVDGAAALKAARTAIFAGDAIAAVRLPAFVFLALPVAPHPRGCGRLSRSGGVGIPAVRQRRGDAAGDHPLAIGRKWNRQADPGRRRVLQLAGQAAVVAPAAVLGYGTFIQRLDFRVREVDVPIAELPGDLEGLRHPADQRHPPRTRF